MVDPNLFFVVLLSAFSHSEYQENIWPLPDQLSFAGLGVPRSKQDFDI